MEIGYWRLEIGEWQKAKRKKMNWNKVKIDVVKEEWVIENEDNKAPKGRHYA